MLSIWVIIRTFPVTPCFSSPARRDCVLANAAFAIRVICPEKEVAECLDEARESLLGGKAAVAFRKFVEINS